MKMKSSEYVFVIIAFVVIIGLTSCCAAKGVVPFYQDSIFTHQYPYEPYANMLETPAKYTPEVISQSSGATQNSVTYKNVRGFDGIFPSPSSEEPNIDLFNDLEGNSRCVNQSSGLSNSKGPLCLTSELKQQLLTRGGNLTGADSQIGRG